jgi:hypothetical protein
VCKCSELALQDLRVHEKYRLQQGIGGGSFGEVYLGMLAGGETNLLLDLGYV